MRSATESSANRTTTPPIGTWDRLEGINAREGVNVRESVDLREGVGVTGEV